MTPGDIQTRYNEAFQFLQARKRRQAEQLKLLSNLRRGDQNVSSNLLLTLFNRILSSVYDNKMQVKFLPSQGINQEQINAYNTLAQSDYQEMKKAKLDYDWNWDTLFFGRGYLETTRFDMKRKIMQPHVINPLVFYYDPYMEEVQSWRYYGKWITKTKSELMLLQNAGILKNINLKLLSPGIDPYLWQYKITRDQARDGIPPPIDPVNGDVYQILEHYDYNEQGKKCVYWVDKLFSKILYEKELDYDDGDEIVAPDGSSVETGSKWPIVVKESFRVPHSSIPISVADLLEDKHRAKAVLLNLAYVAAKDTANPIYWYDIDKVKDLGQFLSRSINQHIPVVGNGADAVGPMNKASTMPQELINFIEMMDAEAEAPIGAGKPMQPSTSKASGTATQAALDQQLNDIAQSLQSQVMQFGEEDFWMFWFHRYAKHAEDLGTKMANIVGVKGVDTQIIDLSKNFSTDYPPGVYVYSAKQAEYQNLVKRRDMMQLYPQLQESMDPDGFRNWQKHVFWPLMLEDPSLIEVMFPKSIDEMNAEAENDQLKDGVMPDVKETDNHLTHIYTHMQVQPKTWELWTHLHWHQQLLDEQKKQQQMQGGAQQGGQNKVSESISFKDLPPEGQQQMAAQAGLQIGLPSPMSTVDKQAQGGSTMKSKASTPQVGKEKSNPISAASPLKAEISSTNSQNNGL